MNTDERNAERRSRRKSKRNPFGLAPLTDPAEHERRRERLTLARDTALAALDRLEEVRARVFTGTTAPLPDLVWHPGPVFAALVAIARPIGAIAGPDALPTGTMRFDTEEDAP